MGARGFASKTEGPIADALLEMGAASPAAIAEYTGIIPGTVRNAIKRMLKYGYLAVHEPTGAYYLIEHPHTGKRYELEVQARDAA